MSPELIKSKHTYSKNALLKKSLDHKKKKTMKSSKSTDKIAKKKQNCLPKKSEATPVIEDNATTIKQ